MQYGPNPEQNRVFPLYNQPQPQMVDQRTRTLRFWFLTLFAGLILTVPAPAERTGMTPRFAGLSMMGSALVGLSTHLSFFLKKPGYNLWEKIKPFLMRHKTATAFMGAGILSMQAIGPFILGPIGMALDYFFGNQLAWIEATMKAGYEKTLAAFNVVKQLMKKGGKLSLDLLAFLDRMYTNIINGIGQFSEMYAKVIEYLSRQQQRITNIARRNHARNEARDLRVPVARNEEHVAVQPPQQPANNALAAEEPVAVQPPQQPENDVPVNNVVDVYAVPPVVNAHRRDRTASQRQAPNQELRRSARIANLPKKRK